jgi:hypothetical protein
MSPVRKSFCVCFPCVHAVASVSIFNAVMVDLTRFVTPDVLRACDFGRITHLMDVGGGSGELIGAIAKQYAYIRGTVFDLPGALNRRSAIWTAWASVVAPKSCLVIPKRSPPAQMPS